MIRVANMERGKNALERRGCWIAVQVRGPGEAGSGGSSSASNPVGRKCPRLFTLGDDKGFEAQDFVAELREINVTPHVAQNTSGRCSAIDGRITRRSGYAVSLRIRRHRGGVRLGHDPWSCCTRCAISGCPSSTGSSLSPWRPVYPRTEAAGGYGVTPGSHPIRPSGAESLHLATVIRQRRAETGHHHGRKPG